MSKKIDLHEIIQDYLRISALIGRSPSRDEYLSHPERKFAKSQIIGEHAFKSWLGLVRAAGHTPHFNARDKRDKQEIRERYHEHLIKELERVRTEHIDHPASERLLVIGDIHAPYHHPDYFDFLLELHAAYNFDRITCVGDEIDHHAISFHDHDPNLLSPGPELEAAILALQPLMKAFPEMDIAESNHGSLHFRKGKHAGLPRQLLASYHDALRAPAGWRWRDEIEVELVDGTNVLIHHARSSNVLIDSREEAQSMIFGHHHAKGGVWWWANKKRKFFASFTGCGIDPKAMAFAYNKLQTKRPMQGCTIVIDGIARWIPMFLDHHDRWTGIVP